MNAVRVFTSKEEAHAAAEADPRLMGDSYEAVPYAGGWAIRHWFDGLHHSTAPRYLCEWAEK